MAGDRYDALLLDDPAWSEREVRQAHAYDAIGARYDEAFPHKLGQLDLGDRLLAELPPDARVLDIGCGTGLPTARQFVDGGCDVTGIDISPVMLDLARHNVPEARVLRCDLGEMDPAPGQYDAVVAFFVLLNLPRARMPAALRLIHRILVPGGRLALAMVEADLDDALIPFLGSRIRVTGYLRGDFSALLRDAGFDVEYERTLSYAPQSSEAHPEIQMFALCRRLPDT
jgi:SAM-dependent methyltransferase